MCIIACQLPVKAPWLNPIEPKWVHGKRAVVEPVRLLTAAKLEERICIYFGCQSQDHLNCQMEGPARAKALSRTDVAVKTQPTQTIPSMNPPKTSVG